MSRGRSYRSAALLLAVATALPACQTAAEGAADELAEVATVEEAPDGGPAVLTLSEAADTRLGMTTAPVTAGPDGLVVPYSALVYAVDGSTWVFVRTEPLTYQRAPVTVARKDGDRVHLSEGPPAGTEVVTVGAAELVGVETGIDGEE
jgi:hypothetical protein